MPGGEDHALVPNASNFQPLPTVNGADASRIIQQLLRFAPSLQGMIGKVQYGPTDDAMHYIDRSNEENNTKWKPEDFPKLNLLGTTKFGLWPSSISLNPRISAQGHPSDLPLDHVGTNPGELLPTVVHEAAHAAGYGDEKTPEEAGQIARHRTFGIPNQLPPNAREIMLQLLASRKQNAK
jgi:hypothetical protein